MNPLSISRLIFDTVPQIYEETNGRYPVEIKINGEDVKVFSLLPLSANLKRYLEDSLKIWEEIRPMTEGEISQILEREWIQQKFVIAWLEAQSRISSWGRILDYARRLSRRLTEHQLQAKTLVIEPGNPNQGGVKISDEDFLKVFDWLGGSPFTYFSIDENLNIKSYEALPEVGDYSTHGFRFYPAFLHPVISNLKNPDSIVVHISENGGIMIANRDGLMASKRSLESWTIYDIDHVLNSISEILKPKLNENHCKSKPAFVARSLFQILFDIMTKMQGALVILDEPKNLPNYMIKGIEKDSDSPMSLIFNHAPSNELLYSIAEVRKLVELSSIDGAIVLDMHGNLIQVGSMVVAHPAAPNRFGTREAAGFSAAKNGATAFKISADGHMSLFFTTPAVSGNDVHRFDFR